MSEDEIKDMERYAMLKQMEHFGVIDDPEGVALEMDEIASRYKSDYFFSYGMVQYRIRISKGIKARMDATFRRTIEASMNDVDVKKIKRYVYHLMEHDQDPNKNILTVKLEI